MTELYYEKLKQDIEKIGNDLFSLISKVKLLPFTNETTFRDWERICSEIMDQINDDIFHISVIGTIKSGKSTLVNYLFHGDYLKRGAGVVTSFITKAKMGRVLRAILKLKGYKEINVEIDRAINGISIYEPKLKQMLPFDIKDPKKVEAFSKMIKDIDINLFLKNGMQDVNYLTLSLYMKGYKQLNHMMPDFYDKKIIYELEDFEKHKRFVSDDSLAIYLKDISVEIDNGIFDESVEVSDCQGSDSPNPLHLLMIQEHLIASQLVIYVISSRMGIREADIKFLYILKEMGIIKDVIFVINFDFDEHKSIHELMEIRDKTKEQINFFVPNAHIFTFSCLFNLLNEMEKRENRYKLTEKERMRLSQWKNDIDFVKFSSKETSRFLEYLKETISKERYAIFLRAWLKRFYIVSSDMADCLSVNIDMLSGDRLHSEELIQKIQKYKFKLDKIRFLLATTLKGSSDKLKNEIRRQIDQFFDKESELIIRLKQFVTQFHISYDRYRQMLQEAGLSHALYMVFMEYKRAIDTYIVQNVNPLIIKFIREMEGRIKEDFVSVLEPYYEMLLEAVSDFKGDGKNRNSVNLVSIVNLQGIKRMYKIKPPSIISALQYNILLNTETIMRFSIYRFLNLMKRLFNKKQKEDDMDEKIRALENGLLRIKRQGFDSLMFNLINYKENMKYQYIFSIIDACKEYVENSIEEQIKNGLERFIIIEDEIRKEGLDKESILKELYHMKSELDHIISYIEKLGNSGSFTHLLK